MVTRESDDVKTTFEAWDSLRPRPAGKELCASHQRDRSETEEEYAKNVSTSIGRKREEGRHDRHRPIKIPGLPKVFPPLDFRNHARESDGHQFREKETQDAGQGDEIYGAKIRAHDRNPERLTNRGKIRKRSSETENREG